MNIPINYLGNLSMVNRNSFHTPTHAHTHAHTHTHTHTHTHAYTHTHTHMHTHMHTHSHTHTGIVSPGDISANSDLVWKLYQGDEERVKEREILKGNRWVWPI